MAKTAPKNVNKDVKNPPRSPKSGALLKPFNSITAKQAAEASVRARLIRKQVRAEMLEKLVSNMDFGDQLLKAIKAGDSEKVDIITKALTLVGLTHNQSEDAVKSGFAVKASTTGEAGDKGSEPTQMQVSIEVVDGNQA